MKRSMFVILAMIFVLGISCTASAEPYAWWDVRGVGETDPGPGNGTLDASYTLNSGETVWVDLFVSDVPEPGVEMMQFEATYSSSQFLWTKGDKNTSPFVYIDDANWPFFPLEQGSAREGIIKAGGSTDFTQTPPSPVPHTGDNILLATLALKCVDSGSEVFDFTDSGESFHLIKPGGSGEFTVDTEAYALTITCDDGGGPEEFIYANSHNYTPSGQPPRYWQVGVTQKPPPEGVHPEYAEGQPDGLLTGWSPETGELILGFSSPLKNVEGADLTIWHFGKPEVADVYVSTQSTDPSDWHLLGTLSDSPFGTVKKDTFDFGSLDSVYLVKIDKRAGGYHTGHYIDAVAGVPGAAPPQVDIKINGQDGPLTLHQSDTLSLAIGLDNNGVTDNADWWLAVNTPFGLYTFYSWVPYLETVYQGPLFYIPLTDLFEFPVSGLPSGPYTFYFVVDTVMDGNLSVDNLYFDYIEVNIEP